MTSVITSTITFLVKLTLNIFCFLGVVCLPFAVVCVIRYIHYYRRGKRIKIGSYVSTYHRRSKIKRLFWDFPDRFIRDMLERSPDTFPYCGLIMVCGEQGAGKTVCVVDLLMKLKKMFPLVRISSNTPIKCDDWEAEEITSPDELILNDNGVKGCIKVLDEIQNWFNSLESKDFPPEMLGEISQQRKQHSPFIGTSQRFTRISKPIREQTHYLLLPLTLFGCLTFVRVYKPDVAEDGTVTKKRRIKTYFFVHSDEIRNAYDTYAKIKRLSLKGWKSRSEQLTDDCSPAPINIIAEPKPKKRRFKK